MIWPVGLNVDHDLGPLPLWALLGAAAVVVSLLVQAFRLREKYPVPVLGFLWMVWDHRKQGWHDKLAGTYVVKKPRSS